jgi:FkbH-like protein
MRAEQYALERERRSVQLNATSLEDYLGSLQMRAAVRPIDEADMQRVVQLLAKTNQFNLTTRRHTAEKVRELIRRERTIGVTLRLRDRFGDYGLVAVVIAVPLEDTTIPTLMVDSFLMSCRVIGRTVEEYLVASLLRQAEKLGYRRIVGEYIPTEKNQLVSGLYERMGFVRQPATAAAHARFELALPTERIPSSFVEPLS